MRKGPTQPVSNRSRTLDLAWDLASLHFPGLVLLYYLRTTCEATEVNGDRDSTPCAHRVDFSILYHTPPRLLARVQQLCIELTLSEVAQCAKRANYLEGGLESCKEKVAFAHASHTALQYSLIPIHRISIIEV